MVNKYRKILFWAVACALLFVCGLIVKPLLTLFEYDLILPVTFVDMPDGLIQVGSNIQNIEVHISGRKSEIETLVKQNLSYTLSLANAQEGISSFSIAPETIGIPSRIKIRDVSPKTIKVKIEKETIRELPVHFKYTGKPAPGYILSEWKLTPDKIFIRGPSNVLEKIDNIDIKPVDLTGLSDTFQKEVALNILENLEVISPNKVILAEIRITENIIEKTFTDIPVRSKENSLSCVIIPNEMNLTVKGPQKIIEKIDPQKDIHVYVALDGSKKGVYSRPAEISLPVELILVDSQPEVFTVTVK